MRQLYQFDGTMAGLLSCVFRAFQFKEFDVEIAIHGQTQSLLFADCIDVPADEIHAERVWKGLQNKLSVQALRQFYYSFLSEQAEVYQHLFDYCLYVFQQSARVEANYSHPSVLAISQWAKKVGREKHRTEAFVRFKKTADELYLSLIDPDFNVLPLIERHFKSRYQDQRWLIYDEKRHYGIYYDLHKIHQVELNAREIDRNIQIGHSQSFVLQLDEKEALYDQLWKDYFRSVNIKERQNLKLHVQYVPKRYWRYLNEKQL